ncbi:MAG TPA: YigZ family protein [Clostridiaceae bacterium]|nr:YigZ family protein [Clostridiaceae bacterium]
MKEGYFLLEEKRSRFIARAKPVGSEAEALKFIQDIKTACWDATHNCYAYSVGNDSLYQRYSDDGEPQGTAGLPMLDVIRKKGLHNVVVVVTRYFGGILLGAGGLVRAYSKACAGGLEDGGEVWVKSCLELKLTTEYHLSGKIQNMLKNEGFIIADTTYADTVTFTVYSPVERKECLEEQVREITGGSLLLEEAGIKDICVDKNGNVLEDRIMEKKG